MTVQGLSQGKNGTVSINRRIPTNGTPVNGTTSQGTLTMDTKPTADDTLTIGTYTYTFVATPAATGDVAIGAAVANSQANLVAAINDGDSFNEASEFVTAGDFAADDCILTAVDGGVAGESVATTETFNAVTNVFDGTTLGTTTEGVDGTLGEAGDCYIDSSYLYFSISDSTLGGGNWRRISLGSAY